MIKQKWKYYGFVHAINCTGKLTGMCACVCACAIAHISGNSMYLHNLYYRELLDSQLCYFLQSKELKVHKSFWEVRDFVVVFIVFFFAIPVVCPDVALIHVVVFYNDFDIDILTVCDLKIFHRYYSFQLFYFDFLQIIVL